MENNKFDPSIDSSESAPEREELKDAAVDEKNTAQAAVDEEKVLDQEPADLADQSDYTETDAQVESGGESAAEAESMGESKLDDEKQDDEPTLITPPVISEEDEKRRGGGALAYAVIMTMLFAVCFVALSVLLILGYGNRSYISGDGSYIEKVVYIREYNSESGYLTLPEVYSKVSPSVVSIESTIPGGTSIGTGIVMDKNGHIATNYHVIDNATSVSIIFINGITVKATVVGGDELSDLAVLKIEPRDDLVPAEFGNSDALIVGEDVCAIGNPANIEYAGSLTQGIISGVRRNVKIYDDSGMLSKTMNFVQTDTTLNPGNSGGPLIDMYGKVIGINSLKLMGGYEGVSFAIPINGALEILNSLIAGEVPSGGNIAQQGVQLGITCGSVSKGKEYSLDGVTTKIAGATGVIVSKEPYQGYCAYGILLLEDIILSVDGVSVTTAEELRTELYKHKVGDTAVFSVYRNGNVIELSITF
jgi:serine protease Do